MRNTACRVPRLPAQVTVIQEYGQGPNALVLGLPAGGFDPSKHRDQLQCAQAELSEEVRLRELWAEAGGVCRRPATATHCNACRMAWQLLVCTCARSRVVCWMPVCQACSSETRAAMRPAEAIALYAAHPKRCPPCALRVGTFDGRRVGAAAARGPSWAGGGQVVSQPLLAFPGDRPTARHGACCARC